MKSIKRLSLKPIHIAAVLVLLVVAMIIVSKKLSPTYRDAGPSDTVVKDGWGYVRNVSDLKELPVTVDESPASEERVRRGFVNRPGQLKSSDKNFDTVEFKLFDNRLFADMGSKTFQVLKGRLRPCPPEQQAVDGDFTGTIRIWRGNERLALDKQKAHDAEIGQEVTIEIKNFDRWIFTQFDFGRLTQDVESAPDKLRKLIKDTVEARRSVELLTGIQEVNRLLQVNLPSEPDPNAKDKQKAKAENDAQRKQAWDKLFDVIENNQSLKQIKAANPELAALNMGVESTPENIRKFEQWFLPIKVWSQKVAEARFKELTLTINGVMLPGVTPRNSYNEAEKGRKDRPSFPLDAIQWARFKLERKTVHPKATDADNELAKANESAWLQLVGKPAFWLACNVTLKLPEAGLELPTRIIVDPENKECSFYLIGIQLWIFVVTVCVFFVILAFLAWLSITTDILRDSNGRVRPDGIEPVSLGKTQMAFWFILIACAYAFLWVTTKSTDTINETCLILLGIGSGTALGAALISESTGARKYLVTSSLDKSRDEIEDDLRDAIVVRLKKLSNSANSQDSETRKEFVALLRSLEHEGNQARSESPNYDSSMKRLAALRRKLQEEWSLPEEAADPETREVADDAISALARKLKSAPQGGAPAPGTAAAQDGEVTVLAEELELLGSQQAEFKKMAETPWRRLFNDWLGEGPIGKFSFHRFQMLAWTMLLGFIFVAKVLDERAMPEFSPMTLALLGISAGTYLGFKLPAAGKQEVSK
ncbi:MAG: hypothetical protein QOE70_2668 [Chthoniobacter sp.]|jgi:hypothetical protein|nr:hypothetical protein [Chthoniobacter sp.]